MTLTDRPGGGGITTASFYHLPINFRNVLLRLIKTKEKKIHSESIFFICCLVGDIDNSICKRLFIDIKLHENDEHKYNLK